MSEVQPEMESPTTAPSVAPSPEALNQQLLYMNNILALNSFGQNPINLAQFSKDQLAEYQLAKLRLSQSLLHHQHPQGSLYNYAGYGQCPYGSEPPKPAGACFNRIDPNRYRYFHDEPKPQHSYIGLIAMAILSLPDQKMVLSDIYQYILDNYPYFRNRGPGWRNSIRHNLSLNDCFIKAGRSANGKGHYWAIHPANLEDFKKGDFRRRKAQRKVRKHMGLSVPEDDEDDESPVPSPVPIVAADKPLCGPSLLATNPFLPNAASATLANPLFSPASSLLTQQAFNLFNTLRFTSSLNPSAAYFNETLYRQLVDLNIKQDLQSNARNSNRNQFSIESLLQPSSKSESDAESESYDCYKKLKRSSPADSGSLPEADSTPIDVGRSVPVNLKIN